MKAKATAIKKIPNAIPKYIMAASFKLFYDSKIY